MATPFNSRTCIITNTEVSWFEASKSLYKVRDAAIAHQNRDVVKAITLIMNADIRRNKCTAAWKLVAAFADTL